MAYSHNLRPSSSIDWNLLCHGEPLPSSTSEKAVSREVLPETYQIEILIAKKSDKLDVIIMKISLI